MTIVDRDVVVAGLDEEWNALVALAGELEPDDWDAPTACPGWTVKDQYSHVLGIEAMLLGRPVPDATLPAHTPHVRNGIGRVNELWVQHYRDQPVTELLADLGEVLISRRADLAGMKQEAFDAEAQTPAGPDTYGRFMRIRVMDQLFHEQDVREALGRPGHLSGLAPELTVDEVTAGLGYAIGKNAGVKAGKSVRFVVTGGVSRTIDVAVDRRAEVVDELDHEPTVTIEIPVDRFLRIVGGRLSSAEATSAATDVQGDHAVGEQVLNGLAFTI